MDQVDAILRLKNCYKELEEIDTENSTGDITKIRRLIAEKMHEIAKVLNVTSFIPKPKVDICEICKEPIRGVEVGTGTGYAHPDCYYKPNVPKPRGPIIHKIHNHPTLEESIPLASDRVIIDREVFDQLLKNWDQIEKYLIQTAIII